MICWWWRCRWRCQRSSLDPKAQLRWNYRLNTVKWTDHIWSALIWWWWWMVMLMAMMAMIMMVNGDGNDDLDPNAQMRWNHDWPNRSHLVWVDLNLLMVMTMTSMIATMVMTKMVMAMMVMVNGDGNDDLNSNAQMRWNHDRPNRSHLVWVDLNLPNLLSSPTAELSLYDGDDDDDIDDDDD